MGPAQARGDGTYPSRMVPTVGLVSLTRSADLVGEAGEDGLERPVGVDDAQDQAGQPDGGQQAVGEGEEAETDAQPPLDDLQDEDQRADRVGDIPRAEGQGLVRRPEPDRVDVVDLVVDGQSHRISP